MLSNVKHVVLVLSGKGGVGKSTVSSQLALTLKDQGYKVCIDTYLSKIKMCTFYCFTYSCFQVGLLDIDLCGPSIPFILNLEGKYVHQSSDGWIPVYTDQEQRLAVMSIGFLLGNRNDAVVWRGPKKTSMIKSFLKDVRWGELDYLIIDTPPGKNILSQTHISII